MTTTGGVTGGTVTTIVTSNLLGTNGTVNIHGTNVGPGQFDPAQGGAADLLGLEKGAALSAEDMMYLLQSLRSKLDNELMAASGTEIQAQKEQRKADALERVNKLLEAAEKSADAKKGGEIGKIFSWIAAAAMTIAGALLMATGVGAAAGAALLVGGITMLATMALQETGGMQKMLDGMAKGFEALGMDPKAAQILATAIVATVVIAVAVAGTVAGGPAIGLTIASSFLATLFTPENLEKMGVPEDQAGWVAMGISIGLAVVAIGTGVGSSIAAAKGAEMGGKLGPKLVEMSTKLATQMAGKLGTSVEAFQKGAAIASYVAQGIQGLAVAGGGAAGIKAGFDSKDAAEFQAKAKELEKELLLLQQLMQDETDRIQEIIKRLQEGATMVLDVMNQADATSHKIATI